MDWRPSAAKLYRALLLAWPATFRDEYGPEMQRVFEDRLREEPRWRVWLDALFDAVFAAPAQRWDAIRGDMRQAVRHILKNPALSTVSILSLALSIGATTTVFSVIYGVLIDPYPYRGAQRMVHLDVETRPGASNWLFLSWPQFREFRQLPSFEDAILTDNFDTTSTGDHLPEAVRTGRISSNAFEYFGVAPLLGRGFTAADDPHVAVLSYRFWQSHYGGRREALGNTLRLDHQEYTIIGVVPPRFRWGPSEVYIPLNPAAADAGVAYDVSARLRPGVSRERAEADVQALLARFGTGRFAAGSGVRISRLNRWQVGNFAETLMVLLGAVFVLLAVGCANVSILLLARGTARSHELRVRAAIGASRARIMSQLLTESMVLSAAGGVAGIVLAFQGVIAVIRWLPRETFPPEADIHVSIPVLIFTTAIALITGVLFGLWPAVQLSRPLNRAGATGDSRRMHSILVASQVALTVLLLAGAGAAARSLLTLQRARLGYDPRNVMSVVVPLPEGSYPAYEQRVSFYERIRKQVAAIPQVEFATLAMAPYPPVTQWRMPVEIFGRPSVADQSIYLQGTTPEYFSALRIPLIKGRTWTEAENTRAGRVAVINQQMARRYWPAADPVGQKIRLPELAAAGGWNVAAPDRSAWLEIIGVAGDTPNNGLRESPSPAMYVPYTLDIGDSLLLVVRTRSDVSRMVQAIREAIHSVDPSQPVTQMETAENWLRSQGWEREQFIALLFSMFAGLALLLAAVGLYSVISYATALRSKEFGIRMALGAFPRQVIGMVLTSAGKTVSAGAVVGLVLSIASNEALARWTTATVYDAWVWIPVLGMLFTVAAVAALLPARRAANGDPVTVLRHD